MNEPKQIELFEQKINRPKRKVQYVPPHSSQIMEVAHAVCQQLGQENASYTNPEVVGGLASFLTFISQRLAIYANKGHQELIPKKKLT